MVTNDLNSLIDVSSMMPNHFWDDLQRHNEEKSAHIPLALVLQAETDHNKAFSSAFHRFDILTIAKTHRVAFKIIGSQTQIREKIEETKQQLNQAVDLLVLCGHGDPSGITLSENF